MDQNIQAFLRVLDASDNSTGGGTASGVAGAMAAGLAAMVARLSMGKKDLAPREHYEKIAAQAEAIAAQLFDGGREDAAAFDRVSSAYKLSQETDEDKASRSLEIQNAMVHAAEVPLSNAGYCKTVLDLCRQLEEKFNANAKSDLECAGYLAKAGLKGCLANVRINLPYIKDETVCRAIKSKMDLMMAGIESGGKAGIME
jgi:formiminotetrahydrofolate cyclodeaminase